MSSRFEFEAIGTGWLIDIEDELSSEAEQKLLSTIKARIDIFDKDYSRFRADSLVTEMSKKAGTYTLPDDAEKMMKVYLDLYYLTDGLLTPLIGQVLVDAGYDPEYSLSQKKELEHPPTWEEIISYEQPLLTLKKPALLDFGAAGKGYLIDLVGEVIEHNNIESYCIDAGGDILYRNKEGKPLRVGLENPQNFDEAIGVVELDNKNSERISLCGSAGSRRKWANFHHIIDPKRLKSPEDIIATWVIADSALAADALASALFFVPSKVLTKEYNFHYLVLNKDYSIDKSDKFGGEVFLQAHN